MGEKEKRHAQIAHLINLRRAYQERIDKHNESVSSAQKDYWILEIDSKIKPKLTKLSPELTDESDRFEDFDYRRSELKDRLEDLQRKDMSAYEEAVKLIDCEIDELQQYSDEEEREKGGAKGEPKAK